MKPAPSAWLCRYHYDPLDRLAGTVTNNQQDVMCFYKKSRLTTEINGALQRTVMEAGDKALAQQRMLGKVTETDLLATDQQRSVSRRVQPSGIESLGYAAYGYQPAQSGLDSVLGFTGERRDPVTGHYLLGNGYRAFNPVLMRFNSPDSLSPFGEGGLNAYAYCQGDPVNYQDPTGHVKFNLVTNRALNRLRDSVIKRAPARTESMGNFAKARKTVHSNAKQNASHASTPATTAGSTTSTQSAAPKIVDLGEGHRLEFHAFDEQERMGVSAVFKNVERNARSLAWYKKNRPQNIASVSHILSHHEYALDFYKHGFGRRVDDVIRARSMLNLEVEIANLRRVTDESSFQLFEMQMSRRYAFDRWLMSTY